MCMVCLVHLFISFMFSVYWQDLSQRALQGEVCCWWGAPHLWRKSVSVGLYSPASLVWSVFLYGSWSLMLIDKAMTRMPFSSHTLQLWAFIVITQQRCSWLTHETRNGYKWEKSKNLEFKFIEEFCETKGSDTRVTSQGKKKLKPYAGAMALNPLRTFDQILLVILYIPWQLLELKLNYIMLQNYWPHKCLEPFQDE